MTFGGVEEELIQLNESTLCERRTGKAKCKPAVTGIFTKSKERLYSGDYEAAQRTW